MTNLATSDKGRPCCTLCHGSVGIYLRMDDVRELHGLVETRHHGDDIMVPELVQLELQVVYPLEHEGLTVQNNTYIDQEFPKLIRQFRVLH